MAEGSTSSVGGGGGMSGCAVGFGGAVLLASTEPAAGAVCPPMRPALYARPPMPSIPTRKHTPTTATARPVSRGSFGGASSPAMVLSTGSPGLDDGGALRERGGAVSPREENGELMGAGVGIWLSSIVESTPGDEGRLGSGVGTTVGGTSLGANSSGGIHLVVAAPGFTIAGSGISVRWKGRDSGATSTGASTDVFGTMRAATSGSSCSLFVRCIDGICTTLECCPRPGPSMLGRARMSCGRQPARHRRVEQRPAERPRVVGALFRLLREVLHDDRRRWAPARRPRAATLLSGGGASWICCTSSATACSPSNGVRPESIW